MLERLQQWDRELFVFLNGMGSESWDPAWAVITIFWSWGLLFGLILFFTFKRLGWRHALLVIGVLAILITFTDQTTNLIKNYIQRLRPSSNPELVNFIRAVARKHKSFSFISGHASNSMAVAFFVYRVMHPYLKYIGFFFLWPLIFGYSRIYLGLHYPGDICAGYLYGLLTGWLALKLYIYLRNRYFPEAKEHLDNPTNSEPITNG